MADSTDGNSDAATVNGGQKQGQKRKRSTGCLPVEERTPKLLKSVKPDLTVVVGGVEFYHYKQILCVTCPFIDTMLAANMREAKESRIEFPDKDPEEWLDVYSFLDPVTSTIEKDQMFVGIITKEDDKIDFCRGAKLLQWFDYLGMDRLVKKYDEITANHLASYCNKKHLFPSYTGWKWVKYLPCAMVQNVIKAYMKHRMLSSLYKLANGKCGTKDIKATKTLLLDDQCGDELWQFLLSRSKFPEGMVAELGREKIVKSPTFKYLLGLCSKDVAKPGKFKYNDWKESSDSEKEPDAG